MWLYENLSIFLMLLLLINSLSIDPYFTYIFSFSYSYFWIDSFFWRCYYGRDLIFQTKLELIDFITEMVLMIINWWTLFDFLSRLPWWSLMTNSYLNDYLKNLNGCIYFHDIPISLIYLTLTTRLCFYQ